MNADFVFLDEAVPGLMWDAKYFGSDNFTGRPVDGYRVNRVAGVIQMARALARAQALANERGLTLLAWDGYRPARAVACFMRWVSAPEDGKTKRVHYPNIEKSQIVPMGYVAEQSGHSRGGAIDLTLFDARKGRELAMGGGFDLMDVISHHGAKGISDEATNNRLLLKLIMERAGFSPYDREWWHYSLTDEPYPNTYYDFPVE